TIIFAFIIKEAQAHVIAQTYQKLYGAHFWLSKENLPTESEYVMTDFGPGNIRFLERIDIVVDRYMTVNGIRVVYTSADGIRREVYLNRVRGWVLEFPPNPQALFKKVLIRIIPSDELAR
ncbi:MAG: hypothetical protein J7M03_07785, partial [Candidatus Desulfofervidaceae bacterium]|nr:hypothetical protein [Candidatus Desulfofervidaceae bacterium]